MKAGPSRRSRMPHRRGALGRACHLPIVSHELLLQIPLRCRPTYRRHLVLLSMTARRIRGHTSHSGSISERPHRRSHRARRESGEHVHCNTMRVVEGKTVIRVGGRRRRRRRRWGWKLFAADASIMFQCSELNLSVSSQQNRSVEELFRAARAH